MIIIIIILITLINIIIIMLIYIVIIVIITNVIIVTKIIYTLNNCRLVIDLNLFRVNKITINLSIACRTTWLGKAIIIFVI